jgi:hypothetical protein
VGHFLTFVVEAWFWRDCIRHHTPLVDEVGGHSTGQHFGGVYVLSRICPVEPQDQSSSRVIGTSKSSAARLIEIAGNGNQHSDGL